MRALIRSGIALSVHDCSDGGLLVAIAEMALAGGANGGSREAGGVGVELYPYEGKLPAHSDLVRRRPGPLRRRSHARKGRRSTGARAAVGVAVTDCGARRFPAPAIDEATGEPLAAAPPVIALKGEKSLALAELREKHEGWMKGLMG